MPDFLKTDNLNSLKITGKPYIILLIKLNSPIYLTQINKNFI